MLALEHVALTTLALASLASANLALANVVVAHVALANLALAMLALANLALALFVVRIQGIWLWNLQGEAGGTWANPGRDSQGGPRHGPCTLTTTVRTL